MPWAAAVKGGAKKKAEGVREGGRTDQARGGEDMYGAEERDCGRENGGLERCPVRSRRPPLETAIQRAGAR